MARLRFVRTLAHAQIILAFGLSSLSLLGCRPKAEKDPSADAEPAPDATAPAENGSAKEAHAKQAEPVPADVVQKVTNSGGDKPYSGPTATIRGVVRVKGDPAPKTELTGGVEPHCEMAEPMFGRLFREGPGRTLADVLVTVTEYKGYVPASREKDTVTVRGEGCAWDTRTIALTFGQRIGVVAADRRPYVPDLVGQKSSAEFFAMPGASEPIYLVPANPGQYALQDSMRLYSRSEVFVLAYSTHDVTGTDGVYEIRGIPVGRARVGAILPSTRGTVQQVIELAAGETKVVDLEIEYSAKAAKP